MSDLKLSTVTQLPMQEPEDILTHQMERWFLQGKNFEGNRAIESYVMHVF